MFKIGYVKHPLHFITPGGTSRGVLKEKPSYFVYLSNGNKTSWGECSLIPKLSIDDSPQYEETLAHCVNEMNNLESLEAIGQYAASLNNLPSIQFGMETALRSFSANNSELSFPSAFTNGESAIPINGLIWMGEIDFMKQQIVDKIKAGFKCLKLKIGALDFQEELELLEWIRLNYSNDLVLRVDANGAFSPEDSLNKLAKLSRYDLHSIEQPIMAGQIEEMAALCAQTPIPIALDEELIGFKGHKEALLQKIKPQYLILKPGLLGGFKESESWIKAANEHNIGWWVTSALESNLGLNAIAQWTFTLNSNSFQGLGTGQLFSNNIPSPLEIRNGFLHYNNDLNWDLSVLNSER